MDDNNSNSIDFLEFKKTMRDYKLGFSDAEIGQLFNAFDISNDGVIYYDEFLRIIRGKLNDNRKQWVHRAFKILDVDGCGEITVRDIEKKYNAKMHPDVKSGKRTEEEVLTEFLETFETHHNILIGGKPDGKVTMEEFEEYYANVSASIDTDEYFELMMKNAWKLDEAAKVYNKGWRRDEEAKAPKATPPAGLGRSPYKRGQGNASSIDNPLMLQSQISPYKRSPVKNSNALEHFRKVLSTRGARGIIGLARQFKIVDNNDDKTICLQEFVQIVKDFKIPINEREIRSIFEIFDRDGSGVIDYDEFIRGVKGKMNPSRQKWVDAAFNKLDRDGSGVIDINDLKGVYCAKNHPDVRSGKRTEDQVLGEFLETFEMHKNLRGGKNDQVVTKEEFTEYYNNVSSSIDDDRYFETLMVNAWKLKGDEPKKPAWSEAYNPRPLTASQNAPFGTTEEPTDYSTALRPVRGRRDEEVKEKAAAGNPTWSKAQKSPVKSHSEKRLIESFRKALLARGTRGILSIQRAFKIIDDDNSKHLCLSEFKKVIKEYRLRFGEDDVEKLFNIFDKDASGHICYDEFLRGVVVCFLYKVIGRNECNSKGYCP